MPPYLIPAGGLGMPSPYVVENKTSDRRGEACLARLSSYANSSSRKFHSAWCERRSASGW